LEFPANGSAYNIPPDRNLFRLHWVYLETHKPEKNLKFPIFTLAGTKRSFVPVAKMKKSLNKVQVAKRI
jgi:hypothetical protein